MSQNQTLTVNLHKPMVRDINVQSSGTIVVGLGNEEYHGLVSVFFEDVNALQEFIRSLTAEVEELESVAALKAVTV